MSFKPEGSSPTLLKNLQHRRVSEILGEHIPDDEAKLLSNGRITCTVCSRRPIFDTIQMLSVHRKGKHHLLELSHYLEHKRTSELKKSKEIQKSFLKSGKVIIPETDTKESSLPFVPYTSKYSGCSKKKNCNNLASHRKFVLDITEPCSKLKSNVETVSIIEPSVNSQVRHYLKSLTRKRPLEKTINKLREGYNIKETSKPDVSQPTSSSSSKIFETQEPSMKRKAEHELKLLESGWIKDEKGNWAKDPNAEFDSDEDEPPSFLEKA